MFLQKLSLQLVDHPQLTRKGFWIFAALSSSQAAVESQPCASHFYYFCYYSLGHFNYFPAISEPIHRSKHKTTSYCSVSRPIAFEPGSSIPFTLWMSYLRRAQQFWFVSIVVAKVTLQSLRSPGFLLIPRLLRCNAPAFSCSPQFSGDLYRTWGMIGYRRSTRWQTQSWLSGYWTVCCHCRICASYSCFDVASCFLTILDLGKSFHLRFTIILYQIISVGWPSQTYSPFLVRNRRKR